MGDQEEGQKRVLIVEDERPLSGALMLKLEHENIQATVAQNGREALELLKQNTYDLILSDLIMPDVDGFQMLEQLAKLPNSPKVYVISNLSQPEDEEKALKLGADKFFIKSDTTLSEITDEIVKA